MNGPLTPTAFRPTGPVVPGSSARSADISPERAELQKAAEGFEAIMIRKMLASARAASFAEETPADRRRDAAIPDHAR